MPFGAHIGASGGTGGYHDCLLDSLRSLLATSARPSAQCSAENYRATGNYPLTVGAVVPARVSRLGRAQHRLLAAVFATVDDSAARRNPYSATAFGDSEVPGLRSGKLKYSGDLVTLTAVRFTADLVVDGTIRFNGPTATADLTSAGATTSTAKLTWAPFSAADSPVVSGTFANAVFAGTILRT